MLTSLGGVSDGLKLSRLRYQEGSCVHYANYRSIDNSALARLELVNFRQCFGSLHRALTVISNGERLAACGRYRAPPCAERNSSNILHNIAPPRHPPSLPPGSGCDYNKNPPLRQLCYISHKILHHEPGSCYYLRQAPASSPTLLYFAKDFAS